MVTHLTTNRSAQCLSCLSGREGLFSLSCGRLRKEMNQLLYITHRSSRGVLLSRSDGRSMSGGGLVQDHLYDAHSYQLGEIVRFRPGEM